MMGLLSWKTGPGALLRLGSLQARAGLRPGASGSLQPARHACRGVATSPRRRLWRSCSTQRGLSAAAAAAAQQQELGGTAASPAAGVPESAEVPHVSVLLEEVLGFFDDLNVGVFVDGTLGAAGHASGVLRRHPELATLVGFDLDSRAHAIAAARLESAGARVAAVAPRRSAAGRVLSVPAPEPPLPQPSPDPTAYIVHSNFGGMRPVLEALRGPGGAPLAGEVDGILLDLGMSSMQVDESDRGFSFMRDGPLDMRMDPSAGSSAEDLVNSASEAELGRIFRDYGEERYWKGIARRIAGAREEEPIRTTQQLVRAIGNPGGGGRGRRGEAKQKHPATRVFQALRIAVNNELQSIAAVLPDAIDCLRPGGRLAVITFHSLEDRIVKWAFRQAAGMAPSDESLPSYCIPFDRPVPQPLVKILTRRPVVPSEEEQAANSRSRSAKLRVVEKLPAAEGAGGLGP